ncbi:MAG: glutathione S-transferase family protein [Rhodoferax sp.]|nr:glutathione S-transferase family protein [Rhodoferax sp.]
MTYTLFYSPDSANVVVRMALEEIGASYEALEVDRRQQAQSSPAFLKFNPQGLLPVLVDPAQDEPLFETAAIVLHLADQHGVLKPLGAAARGRFLKWLFYLSNTLHADLRMLFYTERYASGPAAIAALQTRLHARVLGHLGLLEAELARHGGPWLLGDALSVCDLYLGACVRWSQLYPRGNALGAQAVSALPRVAGLMERLEQREAVRRAFAAEGIAPPLFLGPGYPAHAVV